MNIQDGLTQLVANVTAALTANSIEATIRPCRINPQGNTAEVQISAAMVAPSGLNVSDGAMTGHVDYAVTIFAPYPNRTVQEMIDAEAFLNAVDQVLLNEVRGWRTGWQKAMLMPIMRPSSPPELRGWRISASRVRIFF
jgi:hypothetical protein